MKTTKLSLDVDALRVEPFATTDDGAAKRGTVQAHQSDYSLIWGGCPSASWSGIQNCFCCMNR